MMDVSADLERLVEQAAAERVLAEGRGNEARGLLHRAREARAAADRARAELVDRLEQASVAEAAAMDRLGMARLSEGAADREVDRLGDLAAAGHDAAMQALAKARDAAEVTSAVVRAHQRRVQELAAAREAVEAALAAHDAAEAGRAGERLEELLLAAAEHVDGLLRRACEGGLLVGALVDRCRGMRPAEGWRSDWLAGSLHDHLSRAALVALGPAETAYRVHGVTVARGLRSLSWVVGNLVESWRVGRARSSPGTPAVEGKEAA